MSFFKQCVTIVLISIIFYYNDIVSIPTTKCINSIHNVKKQNKVYIILFFHHIISFFAHFGWLATSRPLLYLYIITIIIIIIHWSTNKDKCGLTSKINKYCNFPKKRLFPDAFWILGFKQYPIWNSVLHYIYFALAIIFSIYKLYFHTDVI